MISGITSFDHDVNVNGSISLSNNQYGMEPNDQKKSLNIYGPASVQLGVIDFATKKYDPKLIVHKNFTELSHDFLVTGSVAGNKLVTQSNICISAAGENVCIDINDLKKIKSLS
jgi:hypothetical protein